ANSSDSLNMFESTRLASFISRVLTPEYQQWLGADAVLTMSTEGSARAMGWDGLLGRFTAGYMSHLVFRYLRHINDVPLHDLVTQTAFTENGSAVDSVMIGGRLVLDHGRLMTVDETKLRHDANAAAARLGTANQQMRQL